MAVPPIPPALIPAPHVAEHLGGPSVTDWITEIATCVCAIGALITPLVLVYLTWWFSRRDERRKDRTDSLIRASEVSQRFWHRATNFIILGNKIPMLQAEIQLRPVMDREAKGRELEETRLQLRHYSREVDDTGIEINSTRLLVDRAFGKDAVPLVAALARLTKAVIPTPTSTSSSIQDAILAAYNEVTDEIRKLASTLDDPPKPSESKSEQRER